MKAQLIEHLNTVHYDSDTHKLISEVHETSYLCYSLL